MATQGLKTALNQASASRVQRMGLVIDHLVDALGGDPSCTLRRAVILADIDEHPGTTQAAVQDRLGVNKSVLNRDIDWLYDHGCLLRQPGLNDARVVHMSVCGYSKKNIDLALDYFGRSHKKLKFFLETIIDMFHEHKPTLRDAKVLTAMADLGEASKPEIMNRIYAGPATTNARALEGLLEEGLIEERNDDVTETRSVT